MMRSTSRRSGFAGDRAREKLSRVRFVDAGGPRRGVEDRIARGIVDRDAQMQRVAVRGRGFRARDRVRNAVGQTVAAADHGQANAVADQASTSLAR